MTNTLQTAIMKAQESYLPDKFMLFLLVREKWTFTQGNTILSTGPELLEQQDIISYTVK